MILFLKGRLETLNLFIDDMSENVEDTVILNTYDPNFFSDLQNLSPQINETTLVITFNNVGTLLSTVDGRNFWDAKGVRLYNILVDAPAWYNEVLETNLKCMHIITIDGYHDKYIHKYFPVYETAKFLPHGGIRTQDRYIKKYEQREIDVIYLGQKQEAGCALELPMFQDKGSERIFNAMLNEAVCVSDTSEYLLRTFQDGENIVFYELHDLAKLPEKITYLLEHPDHAKRIIANQKEAAAHSTWQDRLGQILS